MGLANWFTFIENMRRVELGVETAEQLRPVLTNWARAALAADEAGAKALMSARLDEQIGANLILGGDPEHFAEFYRRVEAAHRAGEVPDLTGLAADVMIERPLATMPVPMDLAKIRPKILDKYFNDPEHGWGNPSVGEIIGDAVTPPSDQIPMIRMGSDLDGEILPGDLLKMAETRRVQAEAVGHPLKNTQATRIGDVLNKNSPLHDELAARVEDAVKVFTTGESDVPVQYLAPNVADIVLSAVPSETPEAVRTAYGQLPPATWNSNLIRGLEAKDQAAIDYVQNLLEHQNATLEGNKPLRFKDVRNAIGGGGDKPPTPPIEGPPPEPPGKGGGTPGMGTQIARGLKWAFLGPDEMLHDHPHLVGGLRLGFANSEQHLAAMVEHMSPVLKFERGSPESVAIFREGDLSLWHRNKLEEDLTLAGKKIGYASKVREGELADDPRLLAAEEIARAEYGLKKAALDDFDARKILHDKYMGDLSIADPGKAQSIRAAAQAWREVAGAERVLLAPQFPQVFKPLEGVVDVPLGEYSPHVFPDIEAFREGEHIVPPEFMDEASGTTTAGGFLRPRRGVVGYSEDAVSLYPEYVRNVGRKTFVEPVLNKYMPGGLKVPPQYRPAARRIFGDKYSEAIIKDENQYTRTLTQAQREYWMNYIKSVMGIPLPMDTWVRNKLLMLQERHPSLSWLSVATDDPRSALRITIGLNNLIFKGTLGMNPSPVIKQINQPMMAWAETNPVAFFIGGVLGSKRKSGRNIIGNINVYDDYMRRMTEDPVLFRQVMHMEGGVKGAAFRFNKLMGDVVMYPMTISEEANRGITFMAGVYDDMIKRGHRTWGEVVRAGDQAAVIEAGFTLNQRMNFIYGSSGMNPYWARNAFLRTFTPFTTYPRGQVENMIRWGREGNVHPIIAYSCITGYFSNQLRHGGIETNQWLNPVSNITTAPGIGGTLGKTVITDGVYGMVQLLNGIAHGDIKEQHGGWRLAGRSLNILAWQYAVVHNSVRRVQNLKDALQVDGWVRNQRGEAEYKTNRTLGDVYSAFTGQPSTNLENQREAIRAGKFEGGKEYDLRQQAADALAPIYRKWESEEPLTPEQEAEYENTVDDWSMRLSDKGIKFSEVKRMIDERNHKKAPTGDLSPEEETMKRLRPELWQRMRKLEFQR